MHRMIPIRCGIGAHFRTRLNHATRLRPPLLVSRRLHTHSSTNAQPRPSKLTAYTGTAVAFGLIYLTVYWASKPPNTNPPSILDQRRFQPFAIILKDPVSSTSAVYTLRPRSQLPSDPYSHLWTRGIWSVEFKQPQLQIARSYTPLPPTEPPGVPGDLRFLIRREQNGEVSSYLDRLRMGAVVDIRGPRVEYEVPEGVSEVLFLAGGTGIAPALQVAYTLLEERVGDGAEWGRPRVRILWANRKREDCTGGRKSQKSSWWSWRRTVTDDMAHQSPNIIVQELQRLEKRFEGRFRVDYMVDEEGSFIEKSDVLEVTRSSVGYDKGKSPVDHGTKLLLVSGPDGFVEFLAGPREWKDRKLEQGRLEGLLGSLELVDWTIVKL